MVCLLFYSEMISEVVKLVPSLEPGFGFDITDLLPDEIIESVQDYMNESVGDIMGCDDD